MRWQDQIAKWLKDNDRAEAWLARKAGLTPTYLNRMTHSRRPLTESARRKLEVATGLVLSKNDKHSLARAR